MQLRHRTAAQQCGAGGTHVHRLNRLAHVRHLRRNRCQIVHASGPPPPEARFTCTCTYTTFYVAWL